MSKNHLRLSPSSGAEKPNFQVLADRLLGIMTNVGKSRLVKVIFTNIHKISDACTDSRYIMMAQCMRNAFTFY